MSDLDNDPLDLPIVFCLHFLGGSAREWSHVAQALRTTRCVALDLPGFGEQAHTPGYTVSEMATTILQQIRAREPHRWFIAGHSMGAKVAAVIARRIEDGEVDVPGLAGLILLAGSPPSPEPMDDEQREKMLGWFGGDADANHADAETFIDENHAEPLSDDAKALAVDDVLRMNLSAWRAWLEHGSREDWASRVGVLLTPALVLAGAEDEKLGPDAQRSLVVPHFTHATLAAFAKTKHLLPLERPTDVARAIDDFARSIAYRRLIDSDRVGKNTRDALVERGRPDDIDYVPTAMDASALATLRAVVDRVVPQTGAMRIDLAARIDRLLADETGDGWRFDTLPPDARAYRDALATLDVTARRAHEEAFVTLDAALQDHLLTSIAEGRFASAGPFDGRQMRDWFEDLRADAVKAYVSHPQTFARLGYSGIAYGGDGEPKSGFARIGPGEREAWEPIAAVDAIR